MTPTTMWLRILANGGMAMALSVVTVVCFWLSSHKFLGHRRLVVSVGLFCLVRSLASVYQMEAGYSNRTGSPEVTILLIISVFTGIWMAWNVLTAASDLLITLTATETLEMLRQDRASDKAQSQLLWEHLAQTNREASASALLETVIKAKV